MVPTEAPAQQPLSPAKISFIGAYVETCSITRACEAAQVPRRTHYYWLATDPVYRDEFLSIKPIVADRLEDEAVRRGFEGIPKPITVAGEREVITEYDSGLLRDLLRAHAPGRFREKQTVEINIGTADLSKLPDDQILKIAAELEQRSIKLQQQAERQALPAAVTIDVAPEEVQK